MSDPEDRPYGLFPLLQKFEWHLTSMQIIIALCSVEP